MKCVPMKEKVEYWNERIGSVIERKEWSLWEIYCLIYTAMTRMKGGKRSEFVKDESKQKHGKGMRK